MSYTEEQTGIIYGTIVPETSMEGTLAIGAPSSWNEITGKPETFPPSTHNHDDRYYTETETNSLLSAKANTSDLSTVATSGSYNDLSSKPTIPTISVSSTGTSTDEVGYITINGIEKKLPSGEGGGATLYQHNVEARYTNDTTTYTYYFTTQITTTSATPITYATFLNVFMNYAGSGKYIPATGFYCPANGASHIIIGFSIHNNSRGEPTYCRFLYVNYGTGGGSDSFSTNGTSQKPYFNQLIDTVVQIN